jgi:capsular exopolysaccharide synthesis family protein
MDLKRYLTLLRRRWLYVLAGALAGVAVAAALAWSLPPSYTASTVLFVSVRADQVDPTQAYEGGLFIQQRVQSYAEIVSSPLVLSPVNEQLGLQESLQTLQGKVTASAPLNTVLIDISVSDGSAARARDIANAVSQQFIQVVNNLETPEPQQAAAASPVKVTIVQSAELPTSPSSPRKKLYLVIGLLVGLVVGVVGAQLRETFDTAVRTKDRAEKLADAPVLASVGEDGQVRSEHLVVRDGRSSPSSEDFRRLRTSIRFLNTGKHVHALVVTGSVAGEGVTTVAGNLAVSLAQAGENVILVDANFRQPMLAGLFGLNSAPGLTNVLTQSVRLDDALQVSYAEPKLRVLASGPVPPNPSEMLGSRQMLDLINALKQRADVVIFDAPPLLPVTDAAALSRLTNGAVLVCWPRSTKADELEHARESLRSVGTRILGLVLNGVSDRRHSVSDSAYGSPKAAAAESALPTTSFDRRPLRQDTRSPGRRA